MGVPGEAWKEGSAAPPDTVLSGALTIARADAVKAALLDMLSGTQGDVTLQCGGATEADLSFIQLTLAGHRSALRQGRALRLQAVRQGAVAAALLSCGYDVPEGDFFIFPTEEHRT